jgi:hypothetical protein
MELAGRLVGGEERILHRLQNLSTSPYMAEVIALSLAYYTFPFVKKNILRIK